MKAKLNAYIASNLVTRINNHVHRPTPYSEGMAVLDNKRLALKGGCARWSMNEEVGNNSTRTSREVKMFHFNANASYPASCACFKSEE